MDDKEPYTYTFYITAANGETIEHYVCEYTSINSIKSLIEDLMDNKFMVVGAINRNSYRSIIRADTITNIEIYKEAI